MHALPLHQQHTNVKVPVPQVGKLGEQPWPLSLKSWTGAKGADGRAQAKWTVTVGYRRAGLGFVKLLFTTFSGHRRFNPGP